MFQYFWYNDIKNLPDIYFIIIMQYVSFALLDLYALTNELKLMKIDETFH